MISFIAPTSASHDVILTVRFEPVSVWKANNPGRSIEGLACVCMPHGKAKDALVGFFVSDSSYSSRLKDDTATISLSSNDMEESVALKSCLVVVVTHQPMHPKG